MNKFLCFVKRRLAMVGKQKEKCFVVDVILAKRERARDAGERKAHKKTYPISAKKKEKENFWGALLEDVFLVLYPFCL